MFARITAWASKCVEWLQCERRRYQRRHRFTHPSACRTALPHGPHSSAENPSFFRPVSRITVILPRRYPQDRPCVRPACSSSLPFWLLWQLPVPGPEDAFIGELSLDGGAQCDGVLPMALAAVQKRAPPVRSCRKTRLRLRQPARFICLILSIRRWSVRHLTGEASIGRQYSAALHLAGPWTHRTCRCPGPPLEARRADGDQVPPRPQYLLIGAPENHVGQTSAGILPPLFRTECQETTNGIFCGGHAAPRQRVVSHRPPARRIIR